MSHWALAQVVEESHTDHHPLRKAERDAEENCSIPFASDGSLERRSSTRNYPIESPALDEALPG